MPEALTPKGEAMPIVPHLDGEDKVSHDLPPVKRTAIAKAAFEKALASTWLAVMLGNWGGRSQGRDYRVMRTFIGLVGERGDMQDDGWRVKISRRDLSERSGVRSKRGLEVSIQRLIDAGWLKVLSRGSSDRHSLKRGNSKGHAAVFLVVRHRGSAQGGMYSHTDSYDSSPFSSPKKKYYSEYRPPLPDNSTDLAINEPHLLRLIDLVRAGLIEETGWTCSKLAKLLGMSRQSMWEALARWDEFGVLQDGTISVDFRRSYAANDAHREVLDREAECRKAALDGTWTPRKARCGRRLDGTISTPIRYPKMPSRQPRAVFRPAPAPVDLDVTKRLLELRTMALPPHLRN